ncbi:MAG: glycosyltransferase [Pusillimonas sp.]|nr:glycosyltransferase [Pusillimonas sp.]
MADAQLHVVHIISGLGQGGAETVLHRLATAPDQTARHTVVSMGDEGVFGPRLRAAGIRVVTLDMPAGRLTWRGLRRLHRFLRAERPDVVQTWMYHADLIGGIVARWAGIRAVSWGIRNSGANLEKSSRLTHLIAWACARLSGQVPAGIIACAQDAAVRHQARGYRADRMAVIPNGYDLSRWVPRPGARERLRREWGIAEEVPLIGSVARWNPLKDHANLLEGFAACARSAPHARCVLVGHGLTPDNEELMALIDRWNLRDKIILLGRRDDVPDVMAALDLHVLSSCAEGFPNVVAEAMAAGVACVVTDVGDAARIVGDFGWVAPPQDGAALGRAMEAALRERGTPAMAERLRQGRERVERLYSLPAMVSAYEANWRQLAARRRTAPSVAAGMARSDQALDAGTGSGPATRSASDARRLLYVVNNPAFFLSHRLPIALAARDAGYEVHVATMAGAASADIVSHGLHHHEIPMSRSGKNPLQECATLFALWRLYRSLRPDVVHAVTIKPVLYGGIAARLAGVPSYVAAVSGLGFIFMRKRGGFDFLRWAALLLYRLALGHRNSRVIFQNTSDRDVLLEAGAVRQQQVELIRGSGVDLDHFAALPEPEGPVVAVMVARLLADKGVREFVEAARMASGRADRMRWMLAGSMDSGNPASISDQELQRWRDEGVVDYVGEQSDVAGLYARSHIAVLPSYREGLPKSLIEAAACARAVVTTDVPGCRDAIEAGQTGLLVPPHDAAALASAVQRLADDAALRKQFGEEGRRLAERAFDVRQVVQRHLDLYDTLIAAAGATRKFEPSDLD